MRWWYVSTPNFTCAVAVENQTIVDAPPILRRFIGQPAKNLGNWLRSTGQPARFERIDNYDHIYAWGNNQKRAKLKGRPCRVLARGAMRSVLVEFRDGQREVVSYRALRKGNRDD